MFNSSSRKNEYNEILFTTLLHNIILDTKAVMGHTRHNMTQRRQTVWRRMIWVAFKTKFAANKFDLYPCMYIAAMNGQKWFPLHYNKVKDDNGKRVLTNNV